VAGLSFASGTSGAWGTLTTGNLNIPLTTWTHIALSRSGSNVRLYVNGVLDTGASITSSAAVVETASPFFIGTGTSDTGGEFFQGYISNLRIVKGTAVYTSAFTPSTTPLQAISNTALLLSGTNSGLYDATLQNNIQVYGDSRVITGVAKYGTGSMYFDGSGDYAAIPSTTNFGYGTGDFTIEVWAYFNSVVGSRTIISHLIGAAGVQPHIFIASNGTLGYYTNSVVRITSSALSTSTWYHIAVCRNSGSTKMFVNGTQAGSTYTDANNYGATAPLGVGVYWSSGSALYNDEFFSGYLDDLRITKGFARYTANFTPPVSAFISKSRSV
jgi:hypothetical protein